MEKNVLPLKESIDKLSVTVLALKANHDRLRAALRSIVRVVDNGDSIEVGDPTIVAARAALKGEGS